MNYQLTAKEKEVFNLLAKNYTNREIAEELGLLYDTVLKRLNKIYRKLGLVSPSPDKNNTVRLQAVLIAQNKDDELSSFTPVTENGYSEWDIRKVSRELTWYDRDLVNAIVTDLILFLKEDTRG